MQVKHLLALSVVAAAVGVAQAEPYFSSNTDVIKVEHYTPDGSATKVAGPAVGIVGVGKYEKEKKAPDEKDFGGSMQLSHVLDKFKDKYTLHNGNKVWNVKGADVRAGFGGFFGAFIPGWVKEIHAGLSLDNSHMTLGRVGDGEIPKFDKNGVDDGIYFGVWHREPGTAFEKTFKETTDAVVYGGDNATTNLDGLTGTAKYDVAGLNHKTGDQANYLTGTLTADFGVKELSGAISGDGKTLDIGKATINANASFTGSSATFTGVDVQGKVQGQFFDYKGEKAAALAGAATFDNNKQADTAFGGKKQ